MAEFNPVFEIDASKLLAKLHLAGQQAIPNSKVINTGIKDNDPKADPNNPGKVTFAFSKSGEYQLSVLRKIQYRVALDIKLNKEIEKADKELVSKYKLPSLFDEKAQEEAAKEDTKKDSSNKDEGKEDSGEDGKKKEADEKTSLTDKDAKAKTAVNDSLHVPSFLDFITEAEDKDDTSSKSKENDEKQKEIDKLHVTIMKELNKYADFKATDGEDKDASKAKSGVKNMFDELGYEKSEKPEDFDAVWKKFNECYVAENKHRVEYKQQMLDELNGEVIDDLKKYFINFAGKDNQAKIDQNAIAQIILDTDGSVFDDPTKFDSVKDSKIDVGAVQSEMEKEEEERKQKEWHKPVTRSVGCAVGYKVDIE